MSSIATGAITPQKKWRTPLIALFVAAACTCCTKNNQEKDLTHIRGQKLFTTCIPCHDHNGEGNRAIEAPTIAALPAWYVESTLMKFKHDSRGEHPKDTAGLRMRSMAKTLSDEDIPIVAKYVASLKPVAIEYTITGDTALGERHYGLCVACHQSDGSGNQDLHAPPLNTNDWYIKASLSKFKHGIRGGDPQKDPFGFTMGPMAKSLTTEEDINAVIDYIAALHGKRGISATASKP